MVQVDWFQGFGRISFLHDQILDFQNFVGESYVKSTPLATQILLRLFIDVTTL